jgi:signal transduction histidine kinase
VLSIGTDITERKKMEEALKRSHEELELQVMERTAELETAHDRLRNLAAHLQTIREDDRRSIARDIHDELGQTLTAMKIDLSWVHNKYADHKPLFDKVGAMLDRLDATILSVKRICTELRPSLLDDFGLVAAMEWLADEFQERTGIECTVIEELSGIYLVSIRKPLFLN